MIATTSGRLRLANALTRYLPIAVSGHVGRLLYPASYAQRERPTVSIVSSLGNVHFADLPMNHITHALALRGFVEWRNVLIANTLCVEGDTIIDVGANIGTETLLFALRVGVTGRVIAFEPLPDNFTILRKLVASNQMENVSLFQAAVGSCAGQIAFVPPAASWSIGEGHVSTGGAVDNEISVQSVTLDELYEQGDWRAPRMIVMDVEGAELAVLRGAEALIAKCKPYVILEWLPSLMRKQRHEPRVLHEFLQMHSYQMWRIGGWRLESTRANDMEPANYLCIPAGNSLEGKTMAAHISWQMMRAAITPPLRWINPAVVTAARQRDRGARG
jgi:FkbM family methyltransferase